MLTVGQNYFYPDPLTSPFKRLPVGLKEKINLVSPDRPNTNFHGSPTVTANFHSCAKRETEVSAAKMLTREPHATVAAAGTTPLSPRAI